MGGQLDCLAHIFVLQTASSEKEHFTDYVMLVLQCFCEVLAVPQPSLSEEKGTREEARMISASFQDAMANRQGGLGLNLSAEG